VPPDVAPGADLQVLVARTGWSVALTTGERHLHELGSVYRRPRHALRHRQNADAVATAEARLTSLRNKGADDGGCHLLSRRV